MNKKSLGQNGIAHIAAILVVIIVAAIGFVGWRVWDNSKKTETANKAAQMEGFSGDDTIEKDSATTAKSKITVLAEGTLVLPNGYADPTVVAYSGGYRMYANRQSGGPSGYETFISADGGSWTKEHDAVLSGVATGRAIVLPDGIRFYYPGMQPINPSDPPADMYSSFSTDGVTFTKDPGVRLSPRDDAHYVEGPTVFQLPDNSWRMYFNENSIASGNQRDGVIWGASSKDGLEWTRDEEPTLEAGDDETKQEGKPAQWKQVLHPFVVKNPKGGYLMFYNSHSEMYAATSTDGLKWERLGRIGITGADLDGYFLPDGTMRVFYGGFTPSTGGLVYMGLLKFE